MRRRPRLPRRSKERRSIVEFLLILAAFALVDVLAPMLGTDSRDADDWVNHRPV
jgi:hypothetical protein